MRLSTRARPPLPTATRQRRLALALSLAVLSGPALAQQAGDTVTADALAQRLRAVEHALGIAPPVAAPPDTQDLATLDRRLRAVEQGLADRDRQAVAAAPAPAVPPAAAATPATAGAAASAAPRLTLAADKGAAIESADGALQLKLGALVQADHRSFIDDDPHPQNEGFLWRRIRPTLEGSWGELVGFRLTPEFAGDSASIVDAWIDLKFSPAATVRIGKVKGPVGLERLQSGSAIALIERGFPTELAPNRDLGVQLQGALADRTLNYVVGIYNGAADGRDSPTTNPDDHHEIAGRVFLEPWRGRDSVLAGLGFGIAGSTGDKEGGGNSFLPRYRTPGQATFFSYRGTVLADGAHTRWSPQAYWYAGPLGVLGEYISARQALRETATGARAGLDHTAWQVVGHWVLTGEKASYRGVAPDRPFSPGNGGGLGAFELVARYGRLDIDGDAFPLFADTGTSATRATSWGLGLNWYLSRNLKLVANYAQADFDGGAASGDREDEKTFFTRAQLSF